MQNVGDELKPVVEAVKNVKTKPFSSIPTLVKFKSVPVVYTLVMFHL